MIYRSSNVCALEIAGNAQLYYDALLYHANQRRYGYLNPELPNQTIIPEPPHALRKRFANGILPDYEFENVAPSITYRRNIQITYGAISLDS